MILQRALYSRIFVMSREFGVELNRYVWLLRRIYGNGKSWIGNMFRASGVLFLVDSSLHGICIVVYKLEFRLGVSYFCVRLWRCKDRFENSRLRNTYVLAVLLALMNEA